MGRDRLADLSRMPEQVDTGPIPAYAENDEFEEEESTDGQFMAEFFADVKRIRDTVSRIEVVIGDVETRHEELLLAYNKDQTDKANKALEQAMSNISTYSNNVRNLLKKMDQQNKQAKANSAGQDFQSADVRIRESQHSTLSRKFVSVMTRYNDIQTANKRAYRENIKRQCQIVDPNIDEATIDRVVETGGSVDIFKGQRLEEAEKALSDIRDRHEDIQRLERSLVELHEMFVDMSILVSEQGEMIDRIEYSVAKSGNYVESARKKVKRAEELQRAARQKKFCCLFSMVVGAVIIIVIVLQVAKDVTG
eukprot:m.77173 g.77173  ORF g.77173 m.77173 type:complete len:308 (-) comp9117_c0_seq1:2211-3134(-)